MYECTTRTNVPENDCTETEQCHQLGDYLRVKRTLVAVKTWPVYHRTTDVPESDCDCKSEQLRRAFRAHELAGLGTLYLII